MSIRCRAPLRLTDPNGLRLVAQANSPRAAQSFSERCERLASGGLIKLVSVVDETTSRVAGLWISALSLVFLVTIHKFEYLLNAHFVGSRIRTKAYELLALMLLFEALFGLAGLVMAPIVYAYAKAELRAAGWL